MIDSHAQSPDSRPPRSVSSNGVELPFDDRTFAPLQEAPPWPADRAAIVSAFRDNGYLLLRGLLDPEAVLELRAAYFGLFDRRMLAPGTTPRDGIFSGAVLDGLPAYGTPGHPAHDFVRSPRFDRFTRTPVLRELAEALLGGPVELLPRRILRHYDRSTRKASRAHIDYDYMNHGSDRVVTAWVPLGDCPIRCGGLLYLEGSHRIPSDDLDALRDHTDRPDDRRPVSHDLGLTARELGGRWLWADYRAGDVVLHSPHIVHATLDNTSDVMRLSADLRFRRRDAAADERWNGDWSADDGF